MRKITFIFLLFSVTLLLSSYSDDLKETILEGKYSGKNLFIQNVLAGNDEKDPFCIKEIIVNDKAIVKGLLSTAFEIDFKELGFKEGDDLKIVIRSLNDCKPIILNPEVI